MKAVHHKLIDDLVNASLECGVEKGLRSEIEMLILRGEVI